MRVKPLLQDNESGGKVHNLLETQVRGRNILNLTALGQRTDRRNHPMHCRRGLHNQIKQVFDSTKLILQSKSFGTLTTLVNHRFNDARGN